MEGKIKYVMTTIDEGKGGWSNTMNWEGEGGG